jgi:hypothetical protein
MGVLVRKRTKMLAGVILLAVAAVLLWGFFQIFGADTKNGAHCSNKFTHIRKT